MVVECGCRMCIASGVVYVLCPRVLLTVSVCLLVVVTTCAMPAWLDAWAAAADALPIGALEGHTDAIWSVAFAPRGYSLSDHGHGGHDIADAELPILVSASADRTVRVWSVNPHAAGTSHNSEVALHGRCVSMNSRVLLFFHQRPRRRTC